MEHRARSIEGFQVPPGYSENGRLPAWNGWKCERSCISRTRVASSSYKHRRVPRGLESSGKTSRYGSHFRGGNAVSDEINLKIILRITYDAKAAVDGTGGGWCSVLGMDTSLISVYVRRIMYSCFWSCKIYYQPFRENLLLCLCWTFFVK